MIRKIHIALVALVITFAATAQPMTVELPQYPFVNYKANVLHYDTASATMNRFFENPIFILPSLISLIKLISRRNRLMVISGLISINEVMDFLDLLTA